MTDDFSEQEKRGFYKAIYSRRDVRSHFNSKPINDEILSRILNAAHHAPSVGFSQPWNFILIKDFQTKARIKKSFEEEKESYKKRLAQIKTASATASLIERLLDEANLQNNITVNLN